MVLFKRKQRTTKEVGKSIARDLVEIKRREKVLRTLEKEEDIRGKKEEIGRKIQLVKSKRPTLGKKIFRGVKRTGKVIGTIAIASQRTIPRVGEGFQRELPTPGTKPKKKRKGKKRRKLRIVKKTTKTVRVSKPKKRRKSQRQPRRDNFMDLAFGRGF